MPRKNILKQYHLVTSGSLAANLTSNPVNIAFLDNICIQLDFTGTPTGTFNVEVSLDHEQDSQGNVTNAGNWNAVTLSPSATASGAAGSIAINMQELAFPWIRITYTRTSGTGSLSAWIGAKEI